MVKAAVTPISPAPLLGALRKARESASFTQEQLAQLAGLSRMTVARAEAPDADVQLSTFLQLAGALGFHATLTPPKADVSGAPRAVTHRGVAYNRVTGAAAQRNPQEASLAKAWEAVNAPNPHLTPMLESLMPGHTQEQATAAATVIQWMGSEVGMDFLQRALAQCGWQLVPTAAPQARAR